MTISANLPDPDRRPTPPPTGCWTCDFIGPAESRYQGGLFEMHRAMVGEPVTTPLVPIVGRINREPIRAYRYRPWMGPFNWVRPWVWVVSAGVLVVSVWVMLP